MTDIQPPADASPPPTDGAFCPLAQCRDAEECQQLLGLMDLAAIMVRDLPGTIRLWSEGCRRLYGWTAAEAIGQVSQDLLRTVYPVPKAEVDVALLRDGEWNGELRNRAQDGTEVIVLARKVLHRNPDGTVFSIMENVTSLRHVEAALSFSEARLRLVQQVGRIAWSDWVLPESASRVSEDFAQLYGLPPGQTHVSEEEWLALVHPEDRSRVVAGLHTIRGAGGPLASQFRIRRADGSVRWLAMRAEAFLDQEGRLLRVTSAQQDISEIVAAREASAARRDELVRLVEQRTAALAEAEARFHGIFDSQFQFIGLLAPDGTLLEANRTAVEAGGLTRDDVIGRPFWETGWWPTAERDRLRSDIADAARGMLVRHEVENTGAGGRALWVDFSLKPVRDRTTGAVTAIIAEGRDLTERRDLVGKLVQAQKVQALGQLASGIAHDFNNILQTVSGAAMLIERRAEDHDKIRRLARTTIDAAARGESITRRLLSFARRDELRSEAIEIGPLLKGMREVLAHTLGRIITVQAEAPAGLLSVLADRGQLETALVNLGTNARDAMPDGGTLTYSAEAVHVGEEGAHPAGLAPGDYVRVVATDTGSGMDAATLARVTEPFFTTKPPGQGTGLGLAMAKGFAEQSGGTLTIASTPGAGTAVSLWLRQAGDDAVTRASEEDGVGQPGVALRRILVVDDDDLVRETISAQLEDAGFMTLVAASGGESLALIESGETVDALVCDLSMPGMDGVVTIEKARALRPGLPCFLLTGYVGDDAALSAGDAFILIRKPVAGRVLGARIEAALEVAGGQRG